MERILFEYKSEQFNLIKSNDEETVGSFDEIKWKPKQLEMFKELKKIKQDIWIQIYDVYLDRQDNVKKIGFRLTPEAEFYHEYPEISFDQEGNIITNLHEEFIFYKDEGQKAYKLVNKFYQTLISFQSKSRPN